MDRREIAALLNYASVLDNRFGRILSDPAASGHAIDRWSSALHDVPATTADGTWDATHAVRDYYRQTTANTAQYFACEPHHVLAAWSKHSRAQLSRHTDPTPSVDPDNEQQWRAALAANRHAVASGQAPPTEYKQLTGGPAPEVSERLGAVGSPIPAEVRNALAPYRRRRAERERLAATGQADPLSVRCPWCHAAVDEPCRSRKVDPKKGATSNRQLARAHPSRTDAARALPSQRTA